MPMEAFSMTQLFILPVLLITLLLGTPASAADFHKGLVAWKQKDYATALREFQPLAEQGNALAQNYLGVMYDVGKGVTLDYETAVKWFRLSAEQGVASAQYNLGGMYYFGKGVTQDYTLAHMWWNIAASQGSKGARDYRDIVEKKMTPTDKSNGKRLARECEKKNYKGC